jgi:hypothetical protein
VSGQASLGVDSWGGVSGDGRVEKVIANGLGHAEVLGYASEDVSNGYKPFRDSDLRQPNTAPWRSYAVATAGTKLAQTLDDADARVELLYQVTKAKLDFVYPAFDNATHNDRLQQIAAATIEQQPTDWFRYFVKSHVNSWDTDYTRKLNGPNGQLIVKNDATYWGFLDYGVQTQGEARLPDDSAVVVGADTQWYEGHDDVLVIRQNTAQAVGVYTQIRPAVPALPDLHPAVGVRHDSVSGGGNATVWTVSNRYDLSSAVALRGQVGTDGGRFVQSANGQSRITNIPQSSLRGRLGYDGDDGRWGMELSSRAVGTIRSASGVNYGGYTVFDGNAYVYVDQAKAHQVSLLLENILDRQYATSQTSNGMARVPILGRPLTAELRYKLTF